MPTAILPNVLPTWVPGTVVGAYAELLTDSGQPRPVGAALDTAIVDDSGALAFDELPNAGEAYVAAAQVGGEWHFRYFAVPGATNQLEKEILAREEADAELLAAIASKQPSLGYVPENVANRDTDPALAAESDARYASQKATKLYADAVKSLLPFFNVKRYGAVGDGLADDTAAIQAAIDAAAVIGGVVFFPRGTYLISATLTWKSRAVFEGEGVEASIVKLKAEANVAMVKSSGYGAEGVIGCACYRLRFDGNKAGNPGGGGCLILDGQNFMFEDLVVTNVTGNGVDQQMTSESEKAVAGLDSVYRLVRVVGATGYGIWSNAHDSSLVDCQAIQCTEGGIFMKRNGLMTNCHTWCYSSDATCTKVGMYLGGNVHAKDCIAEGASVAQVQFAGSGNSWWGGEAFDSAGKPDVPLFEFLVGENWGTHFIYGANLHNFGNGGALKFTGNAQASTIHCHIFDPGEGKAAGVGEPASSVTWDITLGGSTARGTIPGFDVRRRRTFTPIDPASVSVPNNTLYVSSATGNLLFRNGEGVTKSVTLA